MTNFGAHLVGSVPLADTETVFRTCCGSLDGHVSRLPDGETGARTNWIGWQLDKLLANPAYEAGETPRQVRLRDREATVSVPEPGYLEAALASWQTFQALQAAGDIPASTRFQVSLPTPLATITLFVEIEDRPLIEPVYEAAILSELEAICASIPHEQLSIQWDTAVEFGVLEGVFPSHLEAPASAINQRLLKLAHAVPERVELGFHLCYGDAGHQHFTEPEDTAHLVAVANHLSRNLTRRLDWLHLPVPKSRNDARYFEPLRALELPAETELYLGLLHMTDGLPGAQARIEAAKAHVENFGVATECGFGRRPEATIEPLLQLHVDALKAL